MGLQWDKPSTNWCRISSIHSSIPRLLPGRAMAIFPGKVMLRCCKCRRGWITMGKTYGRPWVEGLKPTNWGKFRAGQNSSEHFGILKLQRCGILDFVSKIMENLDLIKAKTQNFTKDGVSNSSKQLEFSLNRPNMRGILTNQRKWDLNSVNTCK